MSSVLSLLNKRMTISCKCKTVVLFFIAHVKLRDWPSASSSNEAISTDGCSLRRKPLQALTLRHGGLSVLAPRQLWSRGSSSAVFLSVAGLPEPTESLQWVEICTSHRGDSSWVLESITVFSLTWQPLWDWWWPLDRAASPSSDRRATTEGGGGSALGSSKEFLETQLWSMKPRARN